MTSDSDTHPQGGDAQQAPFMGSVGRQASPETCVTPPTDTPDGEMARECYDLISGGDTTSDKEWADWARRNQVAILSRLTPPVVAQPTAQVREAAADQWTVQHHQERSEAGGAVRIASWSELLRDGKHIAHFPDPDEAEMVLADLLKAEDKTTLADDGLREAVKRAMHMLQTMGETEEGVTLAYRTLAEVVQ